MSMINKNIADANLSFDQGEPASIMLRTKLTPKLGPKEYIYAKIKDDIIFDRLHPGELISESSLAKAFDVSRTPVREAVSWLISDNLLISKPQKGTYVSLINTDRVLEATFTRELIEPQIGKIACTYSNDQNRKVFNEIMDKHKECYQNNDIRTSLLCDIEFHKMFFDLCGYERTWNFLNQLSNDANRVRFLKLKNNFRWHETLEEHLRILESFQRGDGAELEARLKEHISMCYHDQDTIKNMYRDYFE